MSNSCLKYKLLMQPVTSKGLGLQAMTKLLEVRLVYKKVGGVSPIATDATAMPSDGKMLLLTPFDPVFLLVRILLVVGQSHKVSNLILKTLRALS